MWAQKGHGCFSNSCRAKDRPEKSGEAPTLLDPPRRNHNTSASQGALARVIVREVVPGSDRIDHLGNRVSGAFVPVAFLQRS